MHAFALELVSCSLLLQTIQNHINSTVRPLRQHQLQLMYLKPSPGISDGGKKVKRKDVLES